MPLLETKGVASAQGFGLTLQQAAANYIEDVFSTWLYTGIGSPTIGAGQGLPAQTITNGIDLSTKGGLVWVKPRNSPNSFNSHVLVDTVRGADFRLFTNLDIGQSFNSSINNFSTTGFQVSGIDTNNSQNNYASWTFRKQPKFFDVVTWTGDGVGDKTISHSLGSTPGFIIAKRTDSTGDWWCYHRSLGNNSYLYLNANFSVSSNPSVNWNPTSNSFVADSFLSLNVNGATYVAYIFAHDAGGFGLTGTDNVISCGSYTTDTSGNFTTTLGYEPQWILFKNSGASSNWNLIDNMRGWPVGAGSSYLRPNTSGAETTDSLPYMIPTATGFAGINNGWGNTQTYIYIAIRRGPMKTPTSGTSVFTPAVKAAGLPSGTEITVGFPYDMYIAGLSASVANKASDSRLTQNYTENTSSFGHLYTTTTGAETSGEAPLIYNSGKQNSVLSGGWLGTGASFFNFFRRAPGFFDVVCYTGNGTVGRTVTHNLTVVPELMIVKARSKAAENWVVYAASLGATNFLRLNTTAASVAATGIWNDTAPTSTVFTVDGDGGRGEVNFPSDTYVAYLFASCPGVSKVGSYTGTGALQTINCGFTGGARFVLIKRTDSTGDWFTYDSARGITSGNDPYLLMNSTAAEVTGTNYVDTTSVGFQVTAAAPAGLNANGGSYIFLAIA